MIQRAWKALVAAVRLACPRCGERTLFRRHFTMNDRCTNCLLLFEREPGYFVGAIYLNYVATVVPIVAGFLILDATTDIGLATQLLIWSAVGITLPLLLYPYSRSFWLAINHVLDPEDPALRFAGRHH